MAGKFKNREYLVMAIGSKRIFLTIVFIIGLAFAGSACIPQGKDSEQLQGNRSGAPDKLPVDSGAEKESISVDILSVTSPVSPGSMITLFAKATPETLCDIEVGYESGHGEAEALLPKRAQENGLVTWTWTVDPSVKFGKYQIIVTAKESGDKVATAKADLEIKSAEECKK